MSAIQKGKTNYSAIIGAAIGLSLGAGFGIYELLKTKKQSTPGGGTTTTTTTDTSGSDTSSGPSVSGPSGPTGGGGTSSQLPGATTVPTVQPQPVPVTSVLVTNPVATIAPVSGPSISTPTPTITTPAPPKTISDIIGNGTVTIGSNRTTVPIVGPAVAGAKGVQYPATNYDAQAQAAQEIVTLANQQEGAPGLGFVPSTLSNIIKGANITPVSEKNPGESSAPIINASVLAARGQLPATLTAEELLGYGNVENYSPYGGAIPNAAYNKAHGLSPNYVGPGVFSGAVSSTYKSNLGSAYTSKLVN